MLLYYEWVFRDGPEIFYAKQEFKRKPLVETAIVINILVLDSLHGYSNLVAVMVPRVPIIGFKMTLGNYLGFYSTKPIYAPVQTQLPLHFLTHLIPLLPMAEPLKLL